jgi:hypothetical protein
VTERRVSAEQQRRLEKEGFTLEVSPVGKKRLWREPGTGSRLSGDHAFELVKQKEARTLGRRAPSKRRAGSARRWSDGRPTGAAGPTAATSTRKEPPTMLCGVPRKSLRRERPQEVPAL